MCIVAFTCSSDGPVSRIGRWQLFPAFEWLDEGNDTITNQYMTLVKVSCHQPTVYFHPPCFNVIWCRLNNTFTWIFRTTSFKGTFISSKLHVATTARHALHLTSKIPKYLPAMGRNDVTFIWYKSVFPTEINFLGWISSKQDNLQRHEINDVVENMIHECLINSNSIAGKMTKTDVKPGVEI